MFELKKLHKNYKEKVVFKDVSFSMKEGEIAVLLGRSGSGKSTLLRTLSGLEAFDSGEVLFKGNSLKDTQVGMVFQDFNLFRHLTAEENLTLPLKLKANKKTEEAKKIAQELLSKFHLQECANQYPSKLSGGQKQRLAIARAMAMSPSILCMDEPTSALDPKTTHEVLECIKSLASQGYRILMATHDMSILDKIDCSIYLMENGEIQEKVASQEFLKDKTKFLSLSSHVFL